MPHRNMDIGMLKRGMNMRVLVLIPAYNEEEAIVGFVHELERVCPSVDYIIINDCSRDHTLALCRKEGFPFLNLPVNLGIGGAMQTGYLYALEHNYDIAVQMDGDGQHNPADLQHLLEPIERGEADMTLGSRFVEQEGFQSTAVRRMGIRILRWALWVRTKGQILDPTSGYRAGNRKVIELFAHHYAQDYPEPESLVTVIKRNLKIREVPVVMRERAGGQSSINRVRSVYYMLKVTLAVLIFSTY